MTEGLEKSWVNKLTALTAPVRITPTEAYYRSHYYQIDSISADSGYVHKSIGEKLAATQTDPYDPSVDEEVPHQWPKADLQDDGTPKDLVKLAFQSVNEIKGIPGVSALDYELTFGNIHLRLLRGSSILPNQSFLNYPAYLSSFEPSNASLKQTLLSVNMNDVNNLFSLLSLSADNKLEEIPKEDHYLEKTAFHTRLRQFLSDVSISALKSPEQGWVIPTSLLPSQASWTSFAILKGDRIMRVLIPQDATTPVAMPKELEGRGFTISKGTLSIDGKALTFTLPDATTKTVSPKTPLMLPGGVTFPATLVEASIANANNVDELKFTTRIPIQGILLEATVPYQGLHIAATTTPPTHFTTALPHDSLVGDGVLVPRSFKEGGVLIGDRGYLSYQSATATSIQEQRIPIYVAGFYDPGIIPLGGKSIIASKEITSLIRATQDQSEHTMTNGINVRLDNLKQAGDLKTKLLAAFQQHGIAPYWHVETYREYDFTKDLIQQLQSEKNLFTLLATVIIIVACSNIISMLIILVNDKKTEIGILRSMGATSKSIAAIFGLCGCVMGFMGSVIGIAAAVVTLRNLQALIDLISRIQGFDLFNRSLFGEVMPHDLSLDTLSFVLIATVLISLLAGIVPAVKASLLRPSAILRSE